MSLVAAALAPIWALSRWGRPALKGAIKQGVVAYAVMRERGAELEETVSDLLAEAQMETRDRAIGRVQRRIGDLRDGRRLTRHQRPTRENGRPGVGQHDGPFGPAEWSHASFPGAAF